MKLLNRTSKLLIAVWSFLIPALVSATPRIGDQVPNFQITSWEGQRITDQDVGAAELTIMYFFSTRCKPCEDGLTILQEASAKSRELKVLYIPVGKQEKEELRAYGVSAGLTLPVYVGDSATLQRFNALYVHPTVYLIGPHGQIVQILQGSDASTKTLLASVAEKHQQRASPAAARDVYSTLLKRGGGKGLAKAGIGYSLLSEGRFAEAETEFRTLIKEPRVEDVARGYEGLAEASLRQGQIQEANASANEAVKIAPKRSMGRLITAKVLFNRGQKQAAKSQLVEAAKGNAISDFAWQKAQVHYAQGNILREDRQPKIALAAYERAVAEDPYYVEALSNKGVALQETGQPERAVQAFADIKNRRPSDRMADLYLKQAQAAIAAKRDIGRQRYINGLVRDLAKRFNEQRQRPSVSPTDDWTSPATVVTILGFEDRTGADLMSRAGVESLLQTELMQQLQNAHVKVVERDILDKLLGELNLGSSELADPDTALKIGRVFAARLMTTGSIAPISGRETNVSMRMIDTETTDIVLPLSQRQNGAEIDAATVAGAFAKAIVATIRERYPLKGRIAVADENAIIINLGKKHGVSVGMIFNVLGDGELVELNGRILGQRTSVIGEIEAAKVEELMSYTKPRGAGNRWKKNQKIIQK